MSDLWKCSSFSNVPIESHVHAVKPRSLADTRWRCDLGVWATRTLLSEFIPKLRRTNVGLDLGQGSVAPHCEIRVIRTNSTLYPPSLRFYSEKVLTAAVCRAHEAFYTDAGGVLKPPLASRENHRLPFCTQTAEAQQKCYGFSQKRLRNRVLVWCVPFTIQIWKEKMKETKSESQLIRIIHSPGVPPKVGRGGQWHRSG